MAAPPIPITPTAPCGITGAVKNAFGQAKICGTPYLRQKMHASSPFNNMTQLVFCRDNVDPDLVTNKLGLKPTEALKLGEHVKTGVRAGSLSAVGLWKLDLLGAGEDLTVEDQLAKWVELLQPRSAELKSLRQEGYEPYLDCRAERGSLSLCIAPHLLTSLGELSVSLSIWLYEQQ